MSRDGELTGATAMTVYFCEPASQSERALTENSNGPLGGCRKSWNH